MRVLLAETTWHSATAAADLRRAGFLVTSVDDGATLMDFAADGAQSAVLFDLELPDTDGASLMKGLRAAHPQLPVFVLARGTEWATCQTLFQLGADDVVNGPFAPRELAERVRAAVRRAQGFAQPEIQIGPLTIDTRAQQALWAGHALKLTRKEYEILEMLALARDRMVSRDEIMSQLYAWEDEPAARILNVYLSRIRGQITAAGGAPAILQTVWGLGYRLCAEALPDRAA